MNPDTMTLTELRDWFHRESGGPEWKCLRVADEGGYHKFPATLDGADAAFPKGWDWERWQLDWVGYPLDNKERFVTVSRTDCKTTDLYRLGMKAKLAEKENKHGT
jgi:hypothetical protein